MTQQLSQILLVLGGSPELSILVKATAAIALALAAARWARRARASTRHLILASTLVGLLVLPVAAAVTPPIAIGVPVRSVVAGSVAAPDPQPPRPPSSAVEPSAAAPVSGVAIARWSLPPLPAIARTAWGTVAALLVLSLGVALWRFNLLRRHGLPWPDSRSVVDTLSAAAGIRRPVEVLLHEELAAPATCGWLRPAILLPSDAPDWNAADLRRAVVHELEHVRRRDWAVHLLARAACAVFWFHPLVWTAYRRMCLEAERACDDAVLQDAERTDYAAQLVQLARRLSSAPAQPTLAMANRSDLSARVSAILDSTQARGRLALVPAVAVALTIVVLTAAIAPVRAVGRSIEGSAASPTSTASQGGQGRRVSALDRALYEAAEQGDLEDIGALLGAGANVNGVVLGDGSPLIGAARSGKVAAVTLLLDRGADPNLIVEGDGSPLIMAAREGHEEIVDLLLKRGAIIDQVAPGDENALIQASAEGQLRVVRLLVARGANVNARVWVDRSNGQSNIRRGEYRTPLGMARQERHEAVVAYLLSVGARN